MTSLVTHPPNYFSDEGSAERLVVAWIFFR